MKKKAPPHSISTNQLRGKMPSAPRQLMTPTHLGNEARQKIAKALNLLVANAFALYVKTKNFHWHLSGPHFRDYHLLFDEQAEQVFAMIDVLAERVRKIGGLTIHSIEEISRLKTIEDDNDLFVDPFDMIGRLLNDNENYLTLMLNAHEVCDEYDDVATESILEVFIDETERRIWFLYEIQTDRSSHP